MIGLFLYIIIVSGIWMIVDILQIQNRMYKS
jgi:hypothetical protein